MRQNCFRAVSIFLCTISATALARQQNLYGRDALVGEWKATVTSDDTAKDTSDNLTFKGGKFSSENELKDGYEAATYDDKPAPGGSAAQFDVTLTNKDGDTAKWSGLATGSEMSGTLVITKKDGTKTTFSFKATKAPK